MRRSPNFKDKLRIADLEIGRVRHSVARAGRPISVTPREYVLLEYLLLNAYLPVTRESIVEHVWDLGFEGDVHIVDTYIRRLREKVDHAFAFPLIHTVCGHGFVFTDSETTDANPSAK